MELTDALKTLFIETAQTLRGSERRRFLARTVKALGRGGQRRAERELGWNRQTIRKALRELETGLTCLAGSALRRRKRAEEHLPHLLDDITAIVDSQSQTDPQFRTNRPLYATDGSGSPPPTHTAKGLQRRRIADGTHHCHQIERSRVLPDQGGQDPTQKKIPATDAIFERVAQVNQAADAAYDTLRISIDAKATVKVGPFARGGKNRVPTSAADHDFQPEATMTPVGIFLPATDELFLYGVPSKVTSDCLVDQLIQWWERVRERYAHITTLVLNLDNGPANHSRRTQYTGP